MVYTIINLFGPFGTSQINDIHFKYLGQWTRPDAYICSASAQKAELNVVGVSKVSRGKCVSLYTGSSVCDELGGGLGCFSRYYTQCFPRLHALHIPTCYTRRN